MSGLLPCRRYVVFNVKDSTTSTDIDGEFKRLYSGAKDRSLVFVFNMTKIQSMTLPKLMEIMPLVRKYKAQSERYLIETHVIIPEKWAYRLLKCFIDLPIFKTARPVLLHRDNALLQKIDRDTTIATR